MPLDHKTIDEVRQEMKRLDERLKALAVVAPGMPWAAPRESGAVRRASMDLTRALAKLRRHS